MRPVGWRIHGHGVHGRPKERHLEIAVTILNTGDGNLVAGLAVEAVVIHGVTVAHLAIERVAINDGHSLGRGVVRLYVARRCPAWAAVAIEAIGARAARVGRRAHTDVIIAAGDQIEVQVAGAGRSQHRAGGVEQGHFGHKRAGCGVIMQRREQCIAGLALEVIEIHIARRGNGRIIVVKLIGRGAVVIRLPFVGPGVRERVHIVRLVGIERPGAGPQAQVVDAGRHELFGQRRRRVASGILSQQGLPGVIQR